MVVQATCLPQAAGCGGFQRRDRRPGQLGADGPPFCFFLVGMFEGKRKRRQLGDSFFSSRVCFLRTNSFGFLVTVKVCDDTFGFPRCTIGVHSEVGENIHFFFFFSSKSRASNGFQYFLANSEGEVHGPYAVVVLGTRMYSPMPSCYAFRLVPGMDLVQHWTASR